MLDHDTHDWTRWINKQCNAAQRPVGHASSSSTTANSYAVPLVAFSPVMPVFSNTNSASSFAAKLGKGI